MTQGPEAFARPQDPPAEASHRSARSIPVGAGLGGKHRAYSQQLRLVIVEDAPEYGEVSHDQWSEAFTLALR